MLLIEFVQVGFFHGSRVIVTGICKNYRYILGAFDFVCASRLKILKWKIVDNGVTIMNPMFAKWERLPILNCLVTKGTKVTPRTRRRLVLEISLYCELLSAPPDFVQNSF
jgi:hypothetical protein